ncbi:subtilisin-like protein [Wilcoxina mikolae CBS 423.85]|nr:subtilisin-like protein [Wilcoxina mikolae CBS 423.85]
MFLYKSDPTWKDEDVCGHGTHVAGIIGGKRYGVMKKSRLISIKVLDGPSGGGCVGPWSGIIAGINMAWNDAKANNRLSTSVMNLSLGGYKNDMVNTALAKAIAGGLTAVVAAGNGYHADSCSFTPASVDSAITVGSVNITDEVSDFSNLGCCVDIFAPGHNIGSSYLNNRYVLMSGTSMA